ncbi:MAG: alkaline phosphatase family protein [Acidimicrobiia bacterium]
MERRDFLKRAGLIAGAATVGGGLVSACSGRSPKPTFDSVLNHSPKESGIDTVVIVMMENRSFDHYFGWLASDAEYVDAGRRRYGKTFKVVAKNKLSYPDPLGQEIPTAHLAISTEEPVPFRGCDHPIPGHGWNSGRAQRDRGFLGRDSGNDEYALGYYERDDLALYRELVRRFTTCDRWHSSLLAGTFPNRQYVHSATSEGRKEDPIPLEVGIYRAETIWDRLGAARIPARYYYTDLPILSLWGPRLYDHISKIDDYFADAEAGKLPNVVMIDPAFRGVNRSDDHPQGDIRMGQRFVREVLKAFTQSPQWERGMFVLVYDEWGGFFDHVRPAQFADDRASEISGDNFGQGGFRVPAMVISPLVAPGAVDHTLYDHTSIMRFLEWRFLGAPAEGPEGHGQRWWLTERDRNARNVGRALGIEKPDPDLGFDIDMDLKFFDAQCFTPIPGAAIGGPGDSPLSEKLQELTRQRFPDAQARPWILPAESLTPPTTS